MLELFRKNIFLNSLLLLPYVFIIRLGGLLSPIAYSSDTRDNVINGLIYTNTTSPLTQTIVACVLIFIQALIINYIFSNQKISRENTLFAGVFYILFISLVTENNVLSPVLIANTFMLLAINNIMDTQLNTEASAPIFNAGFLLGTAALIYTPFLGFVLYGIIALNMLRAFKFQELLQFLIGVIIPYFMLFTYKYWNDMPFVEFDVFNELFLSIPSIHADSMVMLYVAAGMLTLMLLFSLVNYSNITSKKSVQAKKKINLMYWYILFCVLTFLGFRTDHLEHLSSLAIPMGILVGISASESQRKLSYELVHILLITIVFAGYFKLFNF